MLDLDKFTAQFGSSSFGSSDRTLTPCRGLKLLLLLAIAAASVYPRCAMADWKDEIGYTALKKRLGSALPRGGVIQIAQVEMPSGDDSDYLPDSTDAQLVGQTINGLSGKGGVSNHATFVGRFCIGLSSSVEPGRLLIDSYEANNWAGSGLLQINTNHPPKTETRPVQNHSWIGTFGSECMDTDAIRRMDLVVERDGVLVAAGVKNGTRTAVPHLMCSAYNVIAVGVSNGRSSYGPVDIDTPGRVKPDIVAPMDATSWATPVVSAASSLLLEAIETRGDLKSLSAEEAHSLRPLLVKALLMAGATKAPWSDWHRGSGNPTENGSTPLDYRFGAGQLNIDHSYRILEAGRQVPAGSGATAAGWDCGGASPRVSRRYQIETSTTNQASILLTWYRHISVTEGCPLQLRPELANLDLKLSRATASGAEEIIDVSRSKVDNVEHIYLPALPPGSYTIEVTTDRESKYALAWDLKPVIVLPASPSILAQASGKEVAASPDGTRSLVPAAEPVIRHASANHR